MRDTTSSAFSPMKAIDIKRSSFISAITNIKRNLDAIAGMSAKDNAKELGLPQIQSFSFLKESEEDNIYTDKRLEDLVDIFNRSHGLGTDEFSNHSWYAQLLKGYCDVFGFKVDVKKSDEIKVDIHKDKFKLYELIKRLPRKECENLDRLLKTIEASKKFRDSAFSIPEGKKTSTKPDGVTSSPKRELYDAYLSILMNHILSANIEDVPQPDNKEGMARWDGKDDFSKNLLRRLEAFTNMYAPSSEREVERFVEFLKRYPHVLEAQGPQKSALLSVEKQRNLRSQLITWNINRITTNLAVQDLKEHFDSVLPNNLKADFFNKLNGLVNDLNEVNSKAETIAKTYSIDITTLDRMISDTWAKEQDTQLLLKTLQVFEEVEQVKKFVKENTVQKEEATEERMPQPQDLTEAYICSEQGQYEIFRHCFQKWAEDNKPQYGQHHYDICLQALNKQENDFKQVKSPVVVITAINQKLELAKNYALKEVEKCQDMEYDKPTFKAIMVCKQMWENDENLPESVKKQLNAVVEKIGELKQEYFYDEGKPKLMRDIKYNEDVEAFYKACYSKIDDTVNEIDKHQSGTEYLFAILKQLTNFVFKILSCGGCSNFFETQPIEAVEVKSAISELHQKLKDQLASPEGNSEEVVAACN